MIHVRTADWMKGVLRWAVAAAAAVFAYLVYVYLALPDVRPLRTVNPETTAFIELRAAEAHNAGRVPRRVQHWVSYGRVSPDLKRAVLIAEDDAFWQHEGVDFEQLEESLELDWARGRFTRGGSTITQQLAKNLYLSPSKNPLRKLQELIIARRLEVELKKARILELYLNVIEWGDGVYGAEAAAETYFRTTAAELDPREAALLAAAIVNPRRLNPAHPNARLARRQEMILRRMRAVLPPADSAVPPGSIEPPRPDESLRPIRRIDAFDTDHAARAWSVDELPGVEGQSYMRGARRDRCKEDQIARLNVLSFHRPS
jgi:monofunctional biosynthetic peptidoglycan transglycosylase